MGVRRQFFRGRKRRHFAYPFHVAEDAMQVDGHKTLYPCGLATPSFFLVFLRDRNGLSILYLKNTVELMYNHHQNTLKPHFMTISRYPDEIVAVF